MLNPKESFLFTANCLIQNLIFVAGALLNPKKNPFYSLHTALLNNKSLLFHPSSSLQQVDAFAVCLHNILSYFYKFTETMISASPSEYISFNAPIDKVSTEYLTLSNSSDQIVIFKIKTTNPRQFCVRPNCDYIEPRSSIKIEILMQPENSGQSKDKFLIQAASVTEKKVEIVDHVCSLQSGTRFHRNKTLKN